KTERKIRPRPRRKSQRGQRYVDAGSSWEARRPANRIWIVTGNQLATRTPNGGAERCWIGSRRALGSDLAQRTQRHVDVLRKVHDSRRDTRVRHLVRRARRADALGGQALRDFIGGEPGDFETGQSAAERGVARRVQR